MSIHSQRMLSLLFICCSLPLAALQNTTKIPTNPAVDTVTSSEDYNKSESLTMTPQLRRVDPPSPNMSVTQLEAISDDLRADKMFADAQDYLKAALAKEKNARLYNKMGMVELKLNHLNESRKSFEKAAKLEPQNADALNNLGVIYYKTYNIKKSIKYYKLALTYREDGANIHSNLGTAYFDHKEYAKAHAEYRRALEIDPDFFDHQSSMGISAHVVSQENRAHYNYVIARSFAAQGDTERCLLYLRKAMEEGYKKINDVNNDPEFAQVRKDERFVSLMNNKPVAITTDR
jgi:tetratricopeptide (TPR) repeat protein